MMATTHALAGLLVGLALAPLAPEAAPAVALAGAAGGLAPDLDALSAHRKHLHFPVYATAVALPAAGLAVATRHPAALAAAAFLAGWALHSLSDALGGGRSLRPWNERVDRAVYCHAQGRWWRARRVVPYDGSPADLGVAGVLAVLALPLAGTPLVRGLVAAMLAVSVPYAALRRRLPDYLEAVRVRLGRPDSRR